MTDVQPAQGNDEVEEWESLALGGIGVSRWDKENNRFSERITHGTIFFITPEIRRRNQQQIRNKKYDPFTNGAFRMRKAVSGDRNSEALFKQNSAMDEAELLKILEMTTANFERKLKSMKDVYLVDRLYRLCRAEEVGGKKEAEIKAKLKQLDPSAVLVGDALAAGAEDPDHTPNGPAAAIQLDVEGESKPRQYAGAPS